MKICYYDESGDDGFPNYSSPLFALTALYIDHLKWKDIYSEVVNFRRRLKESHDFPVKLEMHTKQFLLDKSPYREIGFEPTKRVEIVSEFCKFIGQLDIRVVNILINKPVIRFQGYNVLDTALRYSVQRIENDLAPNKNTDARFMIITDEGRVGKMRSTTREMQKINFIPSRYGNGTYRQEIRALLEDPLPKNSKESYFIQICDLIAYLVYSYGLIKTGAGDLPNRLKSYLSIEQLYCWLDYLRPCLNLDAARDDKYGVKIHPK